jgi:aromatic ring-opening dioxygenase LigB subunit
MKIPLKWAEVISVWLLKQFPSKSQNKFVIFSLPHNRLTEGDKMAPEAYVLGKTIYEFLNNLPLKIAILISCDLAHTHKIQGGPEAGTEPYGISELAEPFDKAIEKWARNPVDHNGLESLLIDAKGMLMKALSCGYLGLVMLAAAMKTHVLKGGKFKMKFW